MGALSRSSALAQADLAGLAAESSAIVGATLGVERVDVWMIDEGSTFLQCVDSYNSLTQTHSIRAPLPRDELLVLHMIAQQGHLARSNVAKDAILQTSRSLFAEGTRSVILAGVSSASSLLGLVVCQSIGELRDWSPEESSFVTSVASTLALTVETTR